MKQSTKTIREMQMDRLARFPKNRICFLPGSDCAASLDKDDIAEFRRGHLSFETLKRHITTNNRLPEGSISDEAMDSFLISIGEMYEL